MISQSYETANGTSIGTLMAVFFNSIDRVVKNMNDVLQRISQTRTTKKATQKVAF
ncbi:hypothetical protein MACH26_11200 [Planctobacterium marinum]|uniref:Uncharacterized protein n=1 Tax=Planctobacterium marinum TaxID=1631968 RepID=A0AA48KRN1_9ALTE|nr:hypothetical protein MACH26_11200 [Planctobacterium marinum]